MPILTLPNATKTPYHSRCMPARSSLAVSPMLYEFTSSAFEQASLAPSIHLYISISFLLNHLIHTKTTPSHTFLLVIFLRILLPSVTFIITLFHTAVRSSIPMKSGRRYMCSNHDTSCTTEESSFDSRQQQEVFSSPDRLWGPTGRLFKRHGGRFFRVYSGLGIKLILHAHLVPRIKMTAAIPVYPIRLHIETGKKFSYLPSFLTFLWIPHIIL